LHLAIRELDILDHPSFDSALGTVLMDQAREEGTTVYAEKKPTILRQISKLSTFFGFSIVSNLKINGFYF
jgi:hypothetical protein